MRTVYNGVNFIHKKQRSDLPKSNPLHWVSILLSKQQQNNGQDFWIPGFVLNVFNTKLRFCIDLLRTTCDLNLFKFSILFNLMNVTKSIGGSRYILSPRADNIRKGEIVTFTQGGFPTHLIENGGLLWGKSGRKTGDPKNWTPSFRYVSICSYVKQEWDF